MARDITSGFQTEIESKLLRPAVLVKAEFESGDVNLWSGYGQLIYNSDVYEGAGSLLKISGVQETQELKAISVTFQLSGVPSSFVSLALTENPRGRNISCWFAVLDTDYTLIADPYLLFKGKMDKMPLSDDGETSVISVIAESNLVDLRDSKERRNTPEDHKIDYPTDLFFDFIPTIQDRVVTWGAGRAD
jgi:hypothetical protein